MTTYVAMLRSVNVGGRNRLSMTDLRSQSGSLGYGAVATYLQSGNAVFTATGASARSVGERIGAQLASELGLSVPILVRTAAELSSVVGATPYADLDADPRTVHVTFLADTPDAAAVESLREREDEFGLDRFEVVGTEVHLYCPGGYGETKLNNAYLERRLGAVATTRNWKTVTALAELAAR